MEGGASFAIIGLIRTLEASIRVANENAQPFAALLLDMARIELMSKYHGISNEELKQLGELLQWQADISRDADNS